MGTSDDTAVQEHIFQTTIQMVFDFGPSANGWLITNPSASSYELT